MLVTSTCLLQAYLKSTDMGDTVEQVEALIKRHDAFAKLLTAQDQKVSLSCHLCLADWHIALLLLLLFD